MAKGQIEINIVTQGAEKVASLEKSLSNVGKKAEEAQKETNEALQNAGKGAEKAVKANKDQIKSVDSLKAKLEELTKVRNASTDTKKIKSYNKEIANTEKQVNKLTGTSDKFGKAITRAFAFIGGTAVIAKSVQVISTFDQSIADLGAILGKTGDDLDFFKERSIQLSTETSNSASDVVDAFKLVGSAKPELLANSEALAEVTRQALILANATGLEVTEAVDSLTGSLNQFDLGAESAGKAIDILSAGSKAGAVAVPQLAQGLKNFGAVANANNVTLQEAIALQETLGEKQIEGGEAGSNLRNIILKLSNAGKGFVDGQFDINTALTQTRDELNAIQDPVERSQELTKLFGLESVTAGQILLDNVDTFQRYTLAVDENNVAQEQANQRLSTISGSFDFLKVSLENYVLGVNESTGASSALAGAIKFVGENINLIINTTLALVAVFGTYKAVLLAIKIQEDLQLIRTKAIAFAQKAQAVATGIATTAMKVFNAVIKANPVVLLATAVIGATTAIIALSSSQDENAEKARQLNSEIKELNKTLEKSTNFIKDLNNLSIDVDASVNLDLDSFVALEKDIDGRVNDISKKEIKLRALTEGSSEIKELQEVINKNQREYNDLLKETSNFNLETTTDEQFRQADLIDLRISKAKAQINNITQEGIGLSKEAIEDAKSLLEVQQDQIKTVREQRADEFKAELQRRENEKRAIRRQKEREERAKTEAKNRLKREQDLQRQLNKLTSDSEEERRKITLNSLSGEERVKKELEFKNEELDNLQAFLINQNNLITKDLEERSANERKIISDIGVFRESAEKESSKKIKEIQDQSIKDTVDNQLSLIEERLSGLDIELESNDESLNAGKEIDLLNEKLLLLDEELTKRKEILESQLASNDISEDQKEIIRQQILNLESKGNQEKSNINEAISELGKAKTLQEQFDGFLGNLFGTSNPEEVNQIKESLTQLAQFGAKQFEESVQRQIDANQTLIDRYDGNIAELEGRLDKEKELRENGDANDVERVEKQIQAEQALRNKALQEQEKLARKQEAINKIKVLSELTVAVAQLIASEASKGIIGLAIAGVAIPALFALFSGAKNQASQATTQLAEGDVLDIGKGRDYKRIKGRSHKDGGERLLDHVEIEGQESLGVLRKEVSEKDREQWRKVTQHLNGKKSFNSFFDYPAVQVGQSKELIANVTNINATDMTETNSLIKTLTSTLLNQGSTQDLGSKTSQNKGITRTIRRKN